MEMCLMVAAEQDLPESLNLPVPVNSERPTTTKTTMTPARRLQEEANPGRVTYILPETGALHAC